MNPTDSIRYFDEQFQRQSRAGDLKLNPFEEAALPYLHGRVLDFGCGMGNLAVAAANQGCSVVALDGSLAAISHLQRRATEESLAIEARQAELRDYEVTDEFDAIVSIGLLMFFDCPTAHRRLANLQARVREGGIAAVNVLIEGTTFLGMFSAEGHCLFSRNELPDRFSGWEILHNACQDFAAPEQKTKVFSTVIARKPCSHRSA